MMTHDSSVFTLQLEAVVRNSDGHQYDLLSVECHK